MTAPNLIAKWSAWAPRLLSVLRIVAAFMFILPGTMKLFAFPIGMPPDGSTATLMSQFMRNFMIADSVALSLQKPKAHRPFSRAAWPLGH